MAKTARELRAELREELRRRELELERLREAVAALDGRRKVSANGAAPRRGGRPRKAS